MPRYYHSPSIFVDNLIEEKMGQYYKAFNLDKKEIVEPEWLKLMEHSWINDESVSSVEMLLIEGGRWFKDRIVWGGDYGDMELWDVVYNEEGKSRKTWTKLNNLIEVIPEKYRYIVNFDKEEYIDKKDATENVHPMPLLLADGNGRGGGDYYGSDLHLVEIWKGNSIGILNHIPENFTKLEYNFHNNNYTYDKRGFKKVDL